MSLKNYKNFLLLGKFFIHRTNILRRRNYLNNYQIPLLTPNYWSNSNQLMHFKLILKQVRIILRKPNENKYNQFMSKQSRDSDKYIKLIEYQGAWDQTTPQEKQNVQLLSKVYNSNTYSFEQEGLFGEGFINGENPYALERIKYDPNNQFQKAILGSFCQNNKGQINTNGLDFGFDLSNLQSQISKQDPQIYVINFDHLRNLYKLRSQPVTNPHRFEGITYTHIPYALFLKANLNGKTRFVCLCAAFKYTKENQIKVLSPYLQNIPYQLWNIARMHTSLPHLNDFTVRIHLGRLHFATSQFNVPLYNYYRDNKDNKNINQFFKCTYLPFNQGLEGVNLNSTATLIPPSDSIEEDVLIFRRSDALNLIAKDLENFTFNTHFPEQLIKQNKLQKLVEQGTTFDIDIKLYRMFGQFIDSLYIHFNMVEYQKEILKIINNQLKTVILIQNLPLLLKNLVFAWTIYHAHTKCVLSLPIYGKYRPALLRKAIPISPQNSDLNQDSYISGYLTQADIILLSRAVAVKDENNFLLNNLREKKIKITDPALREIYHRLIKQLEELSKELKTLNDQRLKDQKFKMNWFYPEEMQTSLNI